MFRRVALKVISLAATVALVISILFLINGGSEIRLLGIDFTDTPRYMFIISAAVSAVISVTAEFYGKLAGNK